MSNSFNFNLKGAKNYQAVKWINNPIFRLFRFLGKLSSVLFGLVFFIFLYGFLTDNLAREVQALTLGLFIMLFTFFLGYKIKEFFFNSRLKKPKLTNSLEEIDINSVDVNLADFMSFEVNKSIGDAIKFSKKRKFPEINSTVLFYFILLNNKNLEFIFSRILLRVKDVKNLLESSFKTIDSVSGNANLSYSDLCQKIIWEAIIVAQKKNHSRVEVTDMFIALAEYDLIFKKILTDNNLKKHDIENLVWWLENLEGEIRNRKRFWEKSNLAKLGSFGRDWVSGFTPMLDQFSVDLSQRMKKRKFYKVVGHEKEIGMMERILARKENNSILIVGEKGSGRKSTIDALARKCTLGESFPEINYKKIVELNLTNLLAQIPSAEEAENILNEIFYEVAYAENIILVIDNFHNFVGGAERLGVADISGILAPYLLKASFRLIAVTTFEGLYKHIEQNPAALSLFGKVDISEVSERETLMLLEDLAVQLEFKYKKFISYPALRDIVTYCDKYLSMAPFPEKAIDLLDEVMVALQRSKDKVLLSKHVANLITEKTQIPVGEIEREEKEILLNLEELIHERIINQEEAVKEVSAALRRARADITIRKGPMGTFMFLGPTGVGKTETAKALADIYFGSESKMIRLDMSEFQNINDINRLLGSAGEEGLLTTQVKKNPFALVLLDEIEKAHPNILNLFLQILDEGHVTDGLGRKISFKNVIIIATSNAAYQVILESLKSKTAWSKVKQLLFDYLFTHNIFRPEFINRFDGVIVFTPLSQENLLAIAGLMLNKLKKNLREKSVDFIITDALKEKVAELGYEPAFGARQMTRVIQDKVENIIAVALLSGKVKRGDRIKINPEKFTLEVE